ncbi:MAG: hypothetical protein V7L29_21940 [Nostoc sp.]|uniref:hypothetical protein n=1 Tax=Nostoc sp. TaxID=1180 RepID=UPI002FF52C66
MGDRLIHAEYDKDKWKNDPRDTTTEALAEVIGSLEIALQIVNGDSPSLRDAARTEALRDRTISKTQAEALADYFNVDISLFI